MNQKSNCQHLLDQGESKGVPEKHLLLDEQSVVLSAHHTLGACQDEQSVVLSAHHTLGGYIKFKA